MLSEVNPYVTITPLGPARNILYQVLNFEVFTICEKEECGILERGADIQAFCQGQIASYKIPKYFKFTDYFPMTVTGKVRKVEMREISIGELGLEKAAGMKTA